MILRREEQVKGFDIPIRLYSDEDESIFVIEIDGVEWLKTENKMHSVVLFTMMQEYITEYMTYTKR